MSSFAPTEMGTTIMAECTSCSSCASAAGLSKMGLDIGRHDYIVALAGNPNTGKSSVFNAITGLKQHTGNWPGKTVSRAEGGYRFNDRRYKLVDLPGTYSLLSAAQDEEIAAQADEVIYVPALPDPLSAIVATVPLQIFAYHIATLKGTDVDQPRNLAKSVTVE